MQFFLAAVLNALFLSGALAAPYPPVDQQRPPLVLKSHGIFFAGGKVVKRDVPGVQRAGDRADLPIKEQEILVGQAYVEYLIPEKLRNGEKTPPIVLVPGGGLVGVHFLTTPDGREGWAHYFVRAGFPVYIIDVPGRGRAGFDPDAYNRVRLGASEPKSQAELRIWDSSSWLEWNQGPLPAPSHGANDPSCIGNDGVGAPPVYCNGNLMPALDPEGYQHWLGAHVPEGPVSGERTAGIQAAMEKIGRAIYIGHSRAGIWGGAMANEFPLLFAAMIGVEPAEACAISPKSEMKGISKVPVLSVHGINHVGRPATEGCLDFYDRVKATGGTATYMSLPNVPNLPSSHRMEQAGIWGNGHIMMWETNSDDIAGLILSWIEKHVPGAGR